MKFDGAHFHNYAELGDKNTDMHSNVIKPIRTYRLYAMDESK